MDEQALASLFSLAGRNALVTGASSGLGRAFALTLARAGAQVAVAARRVDKLGEVVAEIERLGGRAEPLAMDVLDRASVIAAFDRMEQRLGTAQIIVNNAGVTGTQRALEVTSEDWKAVIDTNLSGAWMVAQESARRMVDAKVPGSIVNITSILATRVAGGLPAYVASKAGLRHLTRSLALEWARYGIRVNSLAPGYIVTELNRGFLASEAGESLRARVPVRRFGEFKDLDGALLLLASDAGAYITGAEIVVDGGHLCSSL